MKICKDKKNLILSHNCQLFSNILPFLPQKILENLSISIFLKLVYAVYFLSRPNQQPVSVSCVNLSDGKSWNWKKEQGSRMRAVVVNSIVIQFTVLKRHFTSDNRIPHIHFLLLGICRVCSKVLQAREFFLQNTK